MNVKIGLPLSLLSAAIALALPGQAPFARVGIASVVEGEPVGLPPGGTQRILRVGIDMNADEKVTTKADDRAHLVFLDGTSLTIGPNSEVIIDKYVFNPESKTGEMALKVQRGTLRFVGGVISKSSEVKVDTPSASMGIRGAIFTVSVTALGATTANFLFGQSFSVTSQGVTETTTTPGTRIIVTPGSPPTPPASIPPAILQNSMASFQGSVGGQGGNFQAPPGGGAQGPGQVNIGNALAGGGLRGVNSALSPPTARANTPTHQQIVTILTQSGRRGDPIGGGQLAQGGSPQGTGTQQGGGPLQGAGPLQGVGPLQGAGPMQANSPLQGGGPLQGAGPLQGTGPLGSGPLQGAPPLPGDTPLLAGQPAGVGGPVKTGEAPETQVASLLPNMPNGPPPTPPLAGPGDTIPVDLASTTGGPPPGPPTTPPGGNPPSDPPATPPGVACVTCFVSPPPPNPTPPPNNIVNCANVTCN